MAAQNIQPMPAFEPRSDPTSTSARWTRWLERFNKYCEFTNIDFEIKMQIVTNGTSSRLRKKALQDPKYSLANMLIDGRKYETSSAQAVGIEEQFKTRENINAMAMTTPTEKNCYYCGFKYPHDNQPCPAKSAICNHCGIKGHFAKVCRTRGKSFASKGNLEKLQTQGFTSPDKRRQSRWDENKQRKQQAKAVGISQSEPNTESSEEEDYVYTVSQETREKTHATVKINGQDVLFLVDTGATVDIIDSTTYAKLKTKSSLRKSSTKIYAYGFHTPLSLNGQFQATLESKKRDTALPCRKYM